MNIKIVIYLFILLFMALFEVGGEYIDEFYKYFCDNPNYSHESVLQNIHKCYCQPYDQNELDGRPSIVRFPVR